MSTSTSPFVTKVLETLMTAINAGTYDEDGLPPQDVLARELCVSRAPLREAIVILRFCNVLSVRPKTGTQVNPKKDWNWNVKGSQAVERAVKPDDIDAVADAIRAASSVGVSFASAQRLAVAAIDTLIARGNHGGTEPEAANPAVAAIAYALDAFEGLYFLRVWMYGNFDACRKIWPDAPEACYVGADPSLT